MEDTPSNYAAFLLDLAQMAEYFGETLSDARQQLYYEGLASKLTLEEWHGACQRAIRYETVHKVPLIATLLEYAKEVRQQQAWRKPAPKELPEPALLAEEVRKLMATVWRETPAPEVEA